MKGVKKAIKNIKGVTKKKGTAFRVAKSKCVENSLVDKCKRSSIAVYTIVCSSINKKLL